MGCGSSLQEQNNLTKHRSQNISSRRESNFQVAPNALNNFHTTCNISPMEPHNKDSLNGIDSLAARIRAEIALSDTKFAELLSIIEHHPDLKDQFAIVLNIITLLNKFKPGDSLEKLFFLVKNNDENSETDENILLLDFFSRIGGANKTVKLYTEIMSKNGWTYFSERILKSSFYVDKDESFRPSLVLRELRSFWVNATDASFEFAAGLAEAGLFPHLAEDIKHQNISTLNEFHNFNDSIYDESLTILHNCARNIQLRQQIRQVSLVNLLTPFLTSTNTSVKSLTLLTLSYIIDESENHLLLANDRDFDFFLEMIGEAWEDDSHRNVNGYSLKELLQGLGNLAKNDDNKKSLMKKGALKYLKPILESSYESEIQEASKVVWELAFDKENRKEMQRDKHLMNLLHGLEKSNLSGIAKCASGALWVLDMDKKVAEDGQKTGTQLTPASSLQQLAGRHMAPSNVLPSPQSSTVPTPEVKSSKGHVMVSYQWGNQEIIKQIRDSLRSQNYVIWMDVENIKGSTLQAMAEAVEGAAVLLMCMSQRYRDSPNCRMEAEYAFALHKPIIPLLMERGYVPDGWVGILKGANLFFDFSGKYSFESKLDDLVKELGDRGKQSFSESVDGIVPSISKPLEAALTKPKGVSEWSQSDITIWLTHNHLKINSALLNLSGENLKFLKKLNQRAPEFFYTYLKQDLGLKSLNDLMNFSNAIEQLH